MFNLYQNTLGNNAMGQEEAVLMNPVQLAEYLGIGRNMAYSMLNEGIIHGFKIGNQWKVSKQAVDLYIAQKSRLI